MGAVVVVSISVAGDLTTRNRIVTGSLHLSTSYAAGGDSFTLSQFGLEAIDFISINPALNPSSTTNALMLAAILPTTTGPTAAGKIQAFWSAGSATYLAESNSDLSAYVATFRIEGW